MMYGCPAEVIDEPLWAGGPWGQKGNADVGAVAYSDETVAVQAYGHAG